MDGTICKLSKAFEEKQGAVALAETRLCIRGRRPNLESIRYDYIIKSLLSNTVQPS
jgi:hypothetical protein